MARPDIPVHPIEESARRLRDVLALPEGVTIDLSCGDLVLEVPPSLAGRLRVEGRPLPAGRRLLLPGDRVRIGRRWVRLSAGTPAPRAGTRTLARKILEGGFPGPALPLPALVVLAGPAAGRRWPLPPGRHVVGRGLEADVVLAEATVSRRHAVIEVEREGTRIRDQGSLHGVRVGHRPVRRRGRRLRPGDLVCCGAVHLRYLEPPAPPPPPRRPERWILTAAGLLLLGGGAAGAVGLLF